MIGFCISSTGFMGMFDNITSMTLRIRLVRSSVGLLQKGSPITDVTEDGQTWQSDVPEIQIDVNTEKGDLKIIPNFLSTLHFRYLHIRQQNAVPLIVVGE